jgi:hypothetical protein
VIYEYRVYVATPGRMPEVNKRFREQTMTMFKKHAFRVVGFWEPAVGDTSELHYILEWDDMAHMERTWAGFRTDPEWIEIRRKTEANGAIVSAVKNQIWRLCDYSPKPRAV